jgi:hypothetical protein
MKTTIQITDINWFNQIVDQVDTEFCKSMSDNSYHEGSINVYLKNGDVLQSDGQHGSNDFEEEYGFKLVAKL